MSPKPQGCIGCPAYEFSTQWVPDEIKPGAEIYLMLQNPGVQEEAMGQPMVGKTGQKWESSYLKDAGLTRDQVNIGNVIRCRWHGKDDLPPVSSVIVKQAMKHCQTAHFAIPPATKLLVAAGDYACMALTGTTVADGDKAGNGWRGYLKPLGDFKTRELTTPSYWLPAVGQPLPVLITWHIARTFHQPWWILPTRRDWTKVPRILKGTWPIAPPALASQPPNPWPQMFTFDTEFERDAVPGTRPKLHRYSMSWGLGDGETCVIEADQHHIPTIAGRPRVVTQYSPADVQHLDALTHSWGGSVWERFLIEDSVWKHAVLWSDHQHDLNYLGSIYSPYNRWKHLGEANPTLYAGLDATGLLAVDRALEAELDGDPLSRRVWEDIDRPALGEFVRSQYRGIRTDPARIASAIAQLQSEVDDASRQARAIVGWPIKLSSNPQVAHRLYGIEDIKPVR